MTYSKTKNGKIWKQWKVQWAVFPREWTNKTTGWVVVPFQSLGFVVFSRTCDVIAAMLDKVESRFPFSFGKHPFKLLRRRNSASKPLFYFIKLSYFHKHDGSFFPSTSCVSWDFLFGNVVGKFGLVRYRIWVCVYGYDVSKLTRFEFNSNNMTTRNYRSLWLRHIWVSTSEY